MLIRSIDSADNFQTLDLTNELDNIIELDIERDSSNYISEIRVNSELSIYLFDVGIDNLSEAGEYYNIEEI